MATKTISIDLDVYDRLQELRSYPSESFSQILTRTLASPRKKTGGDLLRDIEMGKNPFGLCAADVAGYEETKENGSQAQSPWDE